MSSPAITTVVKMMESLPETTQDQVVSRLRRYLIEVQSEARWDELFMRTQTKLVAVARQAKKEIAAGRAKPMDYSQL